MTPRLIAAAVALALAALAQFPSKNWRTDISKRSIALDELVSGGPPKDGIPALDFPRFETVPAAARWLGEKEPVLVVELGQDVRAYPFQILIWHELVNDQLGDRPVLVSYCPLCNSALVFDRRVRGGVLTFGVSGMLRGSDMVMFDRQTESLWQQITGEALVGSFTGTRLSIVPSQTVPFETFAKQFPNGRVLSRETGHRRPYGRSPYAGYESGQRLMFPVPVPRQARRKPLGRLLAVKCSERAKAYPLEALRNAGVVEGECAGNRFVIFFERGMRSAVDAELIRESRDAGAAGVFVPVVDSQHLSFRRESGKIVDTQTGSTWNLWGIATEGPLAGKRLPAVEHGIYFAFAWLTFYPDTEIVGLPKSSGERLPALSK